MITVIQTPLAATDFNGTAGNGLVNFADLALPNNSEDQTAVVINIAVEVAAFAQAIPEIDCFLFRTVSGLATTERITVRRLLAEAGFSLAGCRIPVPRDFVTDPVSGPSWSLALVTTGKTTLTSFVVSYQKGQSLTN